MTRCFSKLSLFLSLLFFPIVSTHTLIGYENYKNLIQIVLDNENNQADCFLPATFVASQMHYVLFSQTECSIDRHCAIKPFIEQINNLMTENSKVLNGLSSPKWSFKLQPQASASKTKPQSQQLSWLFYFISTWSPILICFLIVLTPVEGERSIVETGQIETRPSCRLEHITTNDYGWTRARGRSRGKVWSLCTTMVID